MPSIEMCRARGAWLGVNFTVKWEELWQATHMAEHISHSVEVAIVCLSIITAPLCPEL